MRNFKRAVWLAFLFSASKPPTSVGGYHPFRLGLKKLLMLIALSIFSEVEEDKNMSRYQKASHVYWRCQYHIAWTPKYRFRILKNMIGKDVYRCIHVYSEQLGCQVVELNVQIDHVHLVIMVPPKLSISKLMGALKGKIALKLFSKYLYLRKNKLWGNHFWQRGYFVDTVGVNVEIIRRYVRHQEKIEQQEQAQLALE